VRAGPQVDGLGTFYDRIITTCITNPPKDDPHLSALEEQVRARRRLTRTHASQVLSNANGARLKLLRLRV
jgi:hypothetical protein